MLTVFSGYWVAAFQAFGLGGVILLIVAAMLLAMAIIISFRQRRELIDEMEVGVIFNKLNNSFCRFEVSPEPTPDHQHANQASNRWFPLGRRLLIFNDPYFVRLKWFEEVRGSITKKSQTASGTLENVRTIEGIPVSIEWKVKYAVDVTLIPDKIKHKLARTLPDFSEKIVTSKVERVIKHLLGMRTIQSLYELGAIQQLEQEVCQRVYRQLSHPVNLGFKEIPAKDVLAQ